MAISNGTKVGGGPQNRLKVDISPCIMRFSNVYLNPEAEVNQEVQNAPGIEYSRVGAKFEISSPYLKNCEIESIYKTRK